MPLHHCVSDGKVDFAIGEASVELLGSNYSKKANAWWNYCCSSIKVAPLVFLDLFIIHLHVLLFEDSETSNKNLIERTFCWLNLIC